MGGEVLLGHDEDEEGKEEDGDEEFGHLIRKMI